MKTSVINNPILKDVKEGDICLFEMRSFPPIYQIARLTNLKYEPEDEKYGYSWLEFKSELLYCNHRLHPKTVEMGVGMNCLGIIQIVPKELLEQIVKTYNMFEVKQFPLSDAEYERLVQSIKA